MIRRLLGVGALVGLLAALPAAAYIPQTTRVNGVVRAIKWAPSAFPIRWRMNPVVGANVSGSREQAEVLRTAFARWQGVSTAAVSFIEGAPTANSARPGLDGINLVTTNVTPEDFDSSALAVAAVWSFVALGTEPQTGTVGQFVGQIFDVDIMLNPARNFSTGETTPSEVFDLESVIAHEVGHLLGLDHSNILSSTMFPTLMAGTNHARELRLDDRIGVSTIYPAPAFLAGGAISGTVRTTTGSPVFGAMVVALDGGGRAVASALTAPDGRYTIPGLASGAYTVYAEPMTSPFTPPNASSLAATYPGIPVNTNFTVRFR